MTTETSTIPDDDWSEEEALEQGIDVLRVCEQWGTVPGSTRCQDCQGDEA